MSKFVTPWTVACQAPLSMVITNLFNEQTIDRLRDSLATTRDELSNVRQTGVITTAINNQTNDILNAQGRYYLNPPCYQGCGSCCNGLY